MDDTSNLGKALITSEGKDSGWIIDSGSTDHMSYNKSLFEYMISLIKKIGVTANGDMVPVTGTGSIALSPTLSLHGTLLIPSLSKNPCSVGQTTEQLDCTVLMFPTFCLFQDILTRVIIRRDTKRNGL